MPLKFWNWPSRSAESKAAKLLRRVFFPPLWVVYPLSAVVFPSLIFLFVQGNSQTLMAYMLYGVSFYALVTLTLALPKTLRILRQSAPAQWYRNSRYRRDPAFRGHADLWRSGAADCASVLFRGVTSWLYDSAWFQTLALYHLLLGLLRLYLALAYRQRSRGEVYERRHYRICAGSLLLLNIPMGVMTLLIIRTDAGFRYPGYLIYLSALMAFASLISAIRKLIRVRKLSSPILAASAMLSLVAATVSILGLQTAMLSAFSPEKLQFRRTMNALTGSFVCGFLVALALYMLWHSRKFRRDPL